LAASKFLKRRGSAAAKPKKSNPAWGRGFIAIATATAGAQVLRAAKATIVRQFAKELSRHKQSFPLYAPSDRRSFAVSVESKSPKRRSTFPALMWAGCSLPARIKRQYPDQGAGQMPEV
jgi:hypothetical protein